MLEQGQHAQSGPAPSPVVLLGHTGFIGRRLYAALAREAGRSISVFSSQAADLTQKADCARLEPVLTPETSLIWLAAVKRQQGDSLATLETNLQICLNLAEVLVRKPVRQVIFLSSTAVYGEDVAYAEPIDEATPPQPTSYYGMAKVFAEQILTKACAALPQTSLLMLRPPLVYGPGEARPSYGPNLFSLALKQAEPSLTLWGQGEELREFLHVDDLVGLIRALLDKPLSGTFNAVSGQSHSFRAVVEALAELGQRQPALSYRARTKACVDHRFDAARLRQALPEFRFRGLREGLLTLLEAHDA